MSKKRAYSLMEIKSVDDEKREIRGIASTITPDRMGDIVEPKGAKYQLPIPLLWQHKHEKPIGNVTEATVTDKGIEIVATIAKGVSEEIDKAWAMIKSGLVRGLSIGFKPIEYSFLDDGGVKFSAWEWYELSAVTVPANAEANIQLIKSIAESEGVSSDISPIVSNHQKNAASGTNKPVILNLTKDKHMKIEELLKMFAEKKSAAIKESNDIMTKASEEGRTLDAEEAERHDELTAEIKSIDEHLVRLESQKALQIQTAEPVDTTKSFANTTTRPHVVVTEKRAEKGLALAQVVKCIGRAQGNYFGALQLAESQKGIIDPRVERVLKAAVAAGSTSNSAWAGALVGDETSVYADFIDYLRPQTIIGKFGVDGIPSLRQVPFRTPLIGQTSGGSGYWVGEGKAKPLTKFDFERTTLEPLKVANIAVVTKEVLANSSPSADLIIRDQLVAALRSRLDTDFIDPVKAAVAGISPASILNGVTGIASSGNDEAAINADIQKLFMGFIAANNAPTSGVFLMTANTALALSLLKNPLGQLVYPQLTMNGGIFAGLPTLVSQHVPDGIVALVNAEDIYIGDDGGFAVDMSDQASLEMSDAPSHDSTTPIASQLVSLWQTNSVGFRAEREINWKRRRNSSVAYLTGVKWGQPDASGG